jgi:hypothetical protein
MINKSLEKPLILEYEDELTETADNLNNEEELNDSQNNSDDNDNNNSLSTEDKNKLIDELALNNKQLGNLVRYYRGENKILNDQLNSSKEQLKIITEMYNKCSNITPGKNAEGQNIALPTVTVKDSKLSENSENKTTLDIEKALEAKDNEIDKGMNVITLTEHLCNNSLN